MEYPSSISYGDYLNVYIEHPLPETVIRAVVVREDYLSKVQAYIIHPILQAIVEICE